MTVRRDNIFWWVFPLCRRYWGKREKKCRGGELQIQKGPALAPVTTYALLPQASNSLFLLVCLNCFIFFSQAKFAITLVTASDLVALSNMPELPGAADAGSGLKAHRFQTSPPMSTYLVAFVVGKLASVSAMVPSSDPQQQPRPVSVWGIPSRSVCTLGVIWGNLLCGCIQRFVSLLYVCNPRSLPLPHSPTLS